MPTDLENRIVEQAKTWIDVKYKDKGRDRFGGVDCIGLIIKVAHEIGFSDFDTIEYPRRPIPQDLLRGMRDHLEQVVPLSDVGHGNIGLFRGPVVPCHTGIIEVDEGGDMWVIHAYAPARKVVRERLVGERDDQMVMAFRYTGN